MTSLKTLPLVIDNQPVQPADSIVVTNHSNHTKSEYVKYVSASVKDAIAAVESSQVAFRSWSQSPANLRREILQKTATLIRENSAELIKIQIEETNCPQQWAVFNVNLAVSHLEEMSGRITSVLAGEIPVVQVSQFPGDRNALVDSELQTPGMMGFVYKRPVGPVLSIPPLVPPHLPIRESDLGLIFTAAGMRPCFSPVEPSILPSQLGAPSFSKPLNSLRIPITFSRSSSTRPVCQRVY